MIKEVIVVEGRDDVQAVKRAVDAETIITNGFALSKNTIRLIKEAKERCGVVVFTDPDFAGEQLRKRIDKLVPGCKHAFLPREEATHNQDVGVENANPEAIRLALTKARCQEKEPTKTFDYLDLVQWGLVGQDNSQALRGVLGRKLGIGYSNGKQFLSRLNNFGVSRAEFEQAAKEIRLRERQNGS